MAEGYAVECNRFAWRGSSREQVADIGELRGAMKMKEIRWAASVSSDNEA